MSEEQKTGMTPKKLMEYILTQMTAEQALLKLLESSLIKYEKLKFDGPENTIHPIIVMTMAAMEMGWNFVIRPDDKDVNGMVTGTQEFVDWALKLKEKKEDNGAESNTTDSGGIQPEV